jgi:hypothetical protein
MTAAAGAVVIRKRRKGLQVQVFAGIDPLTGRKRWLSRHEGFTPLRGLACVGWLSRLR